MKNQDNLYTTLTKIVLGKDEPYLMTGQDRIVTVLPKNTEETTYTAVLVPATEEEEGYLEVTFELSTKLKAIYPCCVVKIDNKSTTLGTLENPIHLKLGVIHEVTIEWSPSQYIESFRIPAIIEKEEP